MGKIENTLNIKMTTTDSIKGSYFEKIVQSLQAGDDPKETFKLECEAVGEIQQNIIDNLGAIYNSDVGYIVVALRSLAVSLENKAESDPLFEETKARQIRNLETALQIMTVQRR